MSTGHRDIIGVCTDPDAGSIEWHIRNPVSGPDYATACGMDGDDSCVGQYGVMEPPVGTKVTCEQCYQYWVGFRALRLRESNFAQEARS